MEKWDTLKAWIQLHASLDNKLSAKEILEYIETLEDEEKRFMEQLAKESPWLK